MTRNILRAIGYAFVGYFSLTTSRYWFSDHDTAFISLLVLGGLFGEVAMPALFPTNPCAAPHPTRRMLLVASASVMVALGLFLVHGAMCVKASCHQ